MSARRLDETIYELRRAAARQSWVWKRSLNSLWRTRSLSTTLFVYGMNSAWSRLARIQAPVDAARFGFIHADSRRSELIRRSFALRHGPALPPAAP